VKYLGWFDSGVCYNLWTRNEPTFDADGNLEGRRPEAARQCRLQRLLHQLPGRTGDRPAHRRSLHRAAARRRGRHRLDPDRPDRPAWNEFLNYRIEPCFFSTDLGVIVNLEKWNSLTPRRRRSCRSVAIQHEIDSVNALRRSGTRISPRWRNRACRSSNWKARRGQLPARRRDQNWERMRELMEEHPGGRLPITTG
jgi:hypothetical protein